ncbi:hypothetical protein HX776_24600 [Pseudomonas agarici]|uniref:hypothetical protein n=1 Tax=Pseudomonas agarici TaxID=46677 RepID=UPI0003762F7D|nr:hypothetical protein [Pseudomonas agarici]NWC11970.1 hypothetical protein [Pseudomonas agarici]SEL91578.1 hypothetical protein SAMN05216604_1565 [Pseudomonas agarici]
MKRANPAQLRKSLEVANVTEFVEVKTQDLSGAALLVLSAHASSLDVPFPHWIGGADADQGPSYCRPCAEAEVAAGRAEYVDGGWHQENDGCCHCETCGRLLEYTLTEYGASEELDHYLGAELSGPVSPEDAFHIARMLEHDETNSQALSIAVRAADLIKTQQSAGDTVSVPKDLIAEAQEKRV